MEDRSNKDPMRFEDLVAWREARELTLVIYGLTRRDPLCRDFNLVGQIRSASVSIMNNLAEGWESLHPAEKISFYNYARRSCGEVRSMSYVLLDNQYIGETEWQDVYDRCVKCGKLISGLIRSTQKRE